APAIPKVYINHGLYMGKINNPLGEDGVYGRSRTTRPHRGMLYKRMFAASSAEREAAIAADSSLAGVVAVTGSLMADRVIEIAKRRDSLRKSFGFEPGDRVIHVFSTWGKDSLAATIGMDLLHAL